MKCWWSPWSNHGYCCHGLESTMAARACASFQCRFCGVGKACFSSSIARFSVWSSVGLHITGVDVFAWCCCVVQVDWPTLVVGTPVIGFSILLFRFCFSIFQRHFNPGRTFVVFLAFLFTLSPFCLFPWFVEPGSFSNHQLLVFKSFIMSWSAVAFIHVSDHWIGCGFHPCVWPLKPQELVVQLDHQLLRSKVHTILFVQIVFNSNHVTIKRRKVSLELHGHWAGVNVGSLHYHLE